MNTSRLIQLLALIFIALTMQSCGSSKGSGSPTGTVQRDGQQVETYTAEETALGKSVSDCLETWSSQETLESEYLALGYTGYECLKIKDVTKLKIILNAYREARLHKEVNWSLVGRDLQKMEQL